MVGPRDEPMSMLCESLLIRFDHNKFAKAKLCQIETIPILSDPALNEFMRDRFLSRPPKPPSVGSRKLLQSDPVTTSSTYFCEYSKGLLEILWTMCLKVERNNKRLYLELHLKVPMQRTMLIFKNGPNPLFSFF